MLIRDIVTGHDIGTAARLLGVGAGIYLMNVLTFAVWFWELDRRRPGGAGRRAPTRTRISCSPR